jgi:hypothetical protein
MSEHQEFLTSNELVVTDMRDPLKPDPFEAIKKSQN